MHKPFWPSIFAGQIELRKSATEPRSTLQFTINLYLGSTQHITIDERYKFKQVAALDWAYFVTFGSELAVVSMLPLFFMETFELDAIKAGLLASGFAFFTCNQ